MSRGRMDYKLTFGQNIRRDAAVALQRCLWSSFLDQSHYPGRSIGFEFVLSLLDLQGCQSCKGGQIAGIEHRENSSLD